MQIRTKMLSTNLWGVTVDEVSYKIHAMTGHVAAEKALELYEATHSAHKDKTYDPITKTMVPVKRAKIKMGGGPNTGPSKKWRKIPKTGPMPSYNEEVDNDYELLEMIMQELLEFAEEEDVELSEEELVELSRKTLASYTKKAASQVGWSAVQMHTTKDPRAKHKYGKTYGKRSRGIEVAADKLAKEEYEDDLIEEVMNGILDAAETEGVELSEEDLMELSKETLRSYRKGAIADSGKSKRASAKHEKSSKEAFSNATKSYDMGPQWKQSHEKEMKKHHAEKDKAKVHADVASIRDKHIALAKTKLKND